jgi:hypothetical protein
MANEIIDFEPFTRNDLDSVLSMLKTADISDVYRDGLISAANWMFDDIVYMEVSSVDDGMKVLHEAEQRILDAKAGASEGDLKQAEFLEQTMLNRLKHRLVKATEGGCPDCVDL